MKIKLLKNHRHAGVNYLAGDVLDVDIQTANYLAELKVSMPSTIVEPTVQANTSRPIVRPATTAPLSAIAPRVNGGVVDALKPVVNLKS